MTQQDNIMRKVQGLLAKAASTEHEGERKVFMAKADELMEKYAIDQAMLAFKDDPKAKLVIRKEVTLAWWYELKDIDYDARSNIYWLWIDCVRHCRCVGGAFSTYDAASRLSSVFGTPTDIEYAQMLFTDLFSQMVGKLRPAYDPDKTMGFNIAVAKSAGMKYADIARWMGHDEWVVYGKPVDNGIMARAYKAHVKEHGEEWITVNPRTYQWSFVESFCSTIRARMHEMRGGREKTNTGSMEVALRDIVEQAREAMFEDYPELRPHEEDCKCKQCSAKRKPMHYRSRVLSNVASSAGRQAGKDARIISGDASLRSRKGINE